MNDRDRAAAGRGLGELVGRLASHLAWVVMLIPAPALAAPGPAVTRLDQVDPDYQWMGEYFGEAAWDRAAGSSSCGLQVIAEGDGKFRARLLAGGLPGNGGGQTIETALAGQRSEQGVDLASDRWRVELRGNRARICNALGEPLGELSKVQRRSALEGLAPPAYSILLFDGRDARAFKNARVQDGLLQVGTELIPTYQSFQMHVEFLVPYMPHSRGQDRGNSGVYLHSRYEIQILDSFGLDGVANECGGLYRQRAPDINMAFPPLTWQTYDITFHAPRFDVCGKKCQAARLTVLHNGVAIHDNIGIADKTGAGQPEGPQALPIKLQDHGNPVQYRNLWLIELP